MKRLTLTLCCWLALLGAVAAEDVKVDANRIVRLKADLTSPDDLVFWSIDKEDSVDAEELPGGKLYFAAPPGTYRVKCVVVPVKDGKISGAQKTSRYVVTVGAPGPAPAPNPGKSIYDLTLTRDKPAGEEWKFSVPVPAKAGRYGIIPYDTPPGPTPPGPTPPGPVPPGPEPGPAPIDAKGLHVLMVVESADLGKYPPAQLNAMYNGDVRAYLNAKCPLGPIPGQHEWWMLDKDTDLSGLAAKWQNAMKRAKDNKDFKTPWLIVSNPDKGGGYEGPVPADPAKMLELLKKYGD
jgi:hypothetical protein